TLEEVLQAVHVSNVGDVHSHVLVEASDVVEVAAVFRDQRVDEQHVAARLRQCPRKGRPDESEATGNEDTFAAKRNRELGCDHRASAALTATGNPTRC